jgi:ABC-type thiamine transport system ATPase subunit
MREDIYELIRKLSEVRKMGVVLVSHQEVGRGFFDTEYFMEDGRINKIPFVGENAAKDDNACRYSKGKVWD